MSLTTTRLELVSADSDAGLLTPGEVAALFRVDTKTVARWAKAGRLASIRTLAGTAATPPPNSPPP